MVAINCIYRGGNFEELVLEIRETKRDCFFDEEAIISPFEQYLNCPLITREDLDLLLKNNDSFSSSLNDEKGLKLIRLILKELGVIDPIEIGSSNYVLNPYFIPKLLEVKDRSVWSYSCSNPRIKTICNTWLIENRSPEGLAKSVIKVLLEYSHSFTQVQSGVYGHIINLSEAFCWENGALLKFSVKKPKCATADFVEISLEFVNRLSDLCIAPDEMKAHQQRILLSAKGPSYDLNIIKDGGFLMAAMAVETILGSISDLRYERQLVCPCCLETHRIQDAETLNYDFVQSHTCLEVMECAKGHFIPKLLRF